MRNGFFLGLLGYIFFMNSCKNPTKELVKITKEIDAISLKVQDECYCTITNNNVMSELADTIEYKFNLKNIIKIDTIYDTYVIVTVNSSENLSKEIYWRNYISAIEKSKFFKEREQAIFSFIKKRDYLIFAESLQESAKKCGAKIK